MTNTHEVENQAPPRVDVNEFITNIPLAEGVHRYDADWATDELTATGAYVATAEFQHDADRANRIEPELHTFDAHGNRIDEVEYDSSYQRVIRAAVAAGAHTSAWASPKSDSRKPGSRPYRTLSGL